MILTDAGFKTALDGRVYVLGNIPRTIHRSMVAIFLSM